LSRIKGSIAPRRQSVPSPRGPAVSAIWIYIIVGVLVVGVHVAIILAVGLLSREKRR